MNNELVRTPRYELTPFSLLRESPSVVASIYSAATSDEESATGEGLKVYGSDRFTSTSCASSRASTNHLVKT